MIVAHSDQGYIWSEYDHLARVSKAGVQHPTNRKYQLHINITTSQSKQETLEVRELTTARVTMRCWCRNPQNYVSESCLCKGCQCRQWRSKSRLSLECERRKRTRWRFSFLGKILRVLSQHDHQKALQSSLHDEESFEQALFSILWTEVCEYSVFSSFLTSLWVRLNLFEGLSPSRCFFLCSSRSLAITLLHLCNFLSILSLLPYCFVVTLYRSKWNRWPCHVKLAEKSACLFGRLCAVMCLVILTWRKLTGSNCRFFLYFCSLPSTFLLRCNTLGRTHLGHKVRYRDRKSVV